MVDIARIGWKSDTSELERAERKLKDLAPAAERVEKASDGVEKSMKKTDSALARAARGASVTDRAFGSLQGKSRKLSESAEKASSEFDSLKRSLDPAYNASRKLDDGIDTVNRALAEQVITADQAERAVSQLNNEYGKGAQRLKKFAQTAKVGGAILGAFVVGMGTKATHEFKAFDAALAETSTLIEGTQEQMENIALVTKDYAGQYGTGATDQVSAYYQAVSAGAEAGAEANALLNQSNKLAVAGVTDVESSIDGLTTVINAYGKSNINAERVSDIMFATVKKGKTTVEEMNASLSQVIPTASALGVPFDAVGASLATMTAQGIPTSQAMTSLNQAFVGILKPTSQATELAKSLGLEFNAQALSAKGLGGFLQDVVDKTDGSTEAMSQLFGSSEALKAVLAITSGELGLFNSNLDAISNSAGATDEAFTKVSESLSFRLDAALAKINAGMLDTGGMILGIVVPALELVANNVDILIPIVGGLTGGVIALGVAMSLNPIGLFAASVAALVAGVIYLNQQLPELNNNFDNLSTPMRATLQTFDFLKTNIVAGFDFMANGIAMVANLITGDLQGALDNANNMTEAFQRSSLGKFEKSAREAVQGWRDEMIDGFQNWYEESKAKVSQLATEIVNWLSQGLSNLGEMMRQKGVDAITGFVNGVLSAPGKVIGAGVAIGKSLLGGTADGLDSHSPSREMMKLGGFAAAGLALGITAQASTVEASSRHLADLTLEAYQEQMEARQQLMDMTLGVSQDLGGSFGQDAELEQLQTKLENQAQILQAAREAQLINEQDYQTRLVAIRAMAEAETIRIMQQSNMDALNAASSGFDSLAQASKDFAGEQSGIYKAMFAVSKAFAIAESIIKIQQGVASAMSLPFPQNLIAAAAVAAEGANIVSNIKSVQAAGFKDGGLIGGVGTGTSDDNLIRASRGEFMVKARSVQSVGRATLDHVNRTGKLPNGATGGGAILNVQVVNNAPGVEHEVQQLGPNDVRVIARQEINKAVPEKMAQEAANPSSQFSTAMAKSKGVGTVRK